MKKIILAASSISLLAVVGIAATKTDSKSVAPTAVGTSRSAVAPAVVPSRPAVRPADQWTQKGKAAASRVAILANGKKAGTLRPEENCEFMVETAYAAFNDPKSLEKVKKVGGGVESYSLLLQAKDQTFTQVSFFYSQSVNQLVAITAFNLSKGWNFSATNPNTATLEGEGCRFLFDFKFPLSPKITAYK